MRYIVTGGAGFIGHNVVRMLEEQGHECLVIDSATDYGFINKKEINYLINQRKQRMRASVHHLDLRNHTDMLNFFRSFASQCSAVIHLASFPRQKAVSKNPIWASDVMSTALVNLLELTKTFKIPKFVYVSSSMVYGDFADGVKEDAVCKPQGQYGIMKLMGEDLVRDYTKRGHFDHVIVRPSAVYGEYDVDDRVVSKFVLAAVRGETLKVNGADERLDFTHVEDTARGISQAVQSVSAVNKTYNITFGNARTLHDAAHLVVSIVRESKSTALIAPRDTNFPSRGTLDITAARQDFGYNPQINLEQGLAQYIDWLRNDPYWKTQI